MQEPTAKAVFDNGGFTRAIIVPVPMGEGYHLHLIKPGKRGDSEIIERQRGGYRVFKSTDAAISTAYNIGFRHIETDLSSL